MVDGVRSHGLTRAEAEVLCYVMAGYAPRDIAATLGKGTATVATQRKLALLRIGARSTAQAIAMLIADGTVALDDLQSLTGESTGAVERGAAR